MLLACALSDSGALEGECGVIPAGTQNTLDSASPSVRIVIAEVTLCARPSPKCLCILFNVHIHFYPNFVDVETGTVSQFVCSR